MNEKDYILKGSVAYKRPKHRELEIQVLAWNRHLNVVELKRLMRIQNYSSLDNGISNGNTYINKDTNNDRYISGIVDISGIADHHCLSFLF
jgi:hypothetical protein